MAEAAEVAVMAMRNTATMPTDVQRIATLTARLIPNLIQALPIAVPSRRPARVRAARRRRDYARRPWPRRGLHPRPETGPRLPRRRAPGPSPGGVPRTIGRR